MTLPIARNSTMALDQNGKLGLCPWSEVHNLAVPEVRSYLCWYALAIHMRSRHAIYWLDMYPL
jgi:hypothetical protein